ncbi:hypothetical protein DFH07DRAFT_750733 [Mycena maculata]|uniref:Uncharacterized protein n=1 Tax=Mycena maculata TaxID=230809 RepID=A0AAD7IFM0_9AGAR|nr:hypothetical protein DFH07DRAFT_750733 [Mycena maculata]
MGLVSWIANDRDIQSMVYIDDTFSAELANHISYYEPYDIFVPTPQAETLRLWDHIGLPHERPKQISGPTLTVIGFDVDPNAMTFTMPELKRAELLAAVREFCAVPKGGRRHSLRNYWQLAGWINWSFNVYPLLKPGLSHVYEKTKGKTNPDAGIFVNRGVIDDLSWFSRHLSNSTGVHLIESLGWEPSDADVVAFCDASLKGLGIYFPELGLGYQSSPPSTALKFTESPAATEHEKSGFPIFYLEAFCVCWCLHQIAFLVRENGNVRVRKITIWTDNSNTFDIFNSLHAKPFYNEILKSAVDVLIANDFQLRVLLLPGKKNVVADALSRWQNDDAAEYHPGLLIDSLTLLPQIPFTPPRETLGADEI